MCKRPEVAKDLRARPTTEKKIKRIFGDLLGLIYIMFLNSQVAKQAELLHVLRFFSASKFKKVFVSF